MAHLAGHALDPLNAGYYERRIELHSCCITESSQRFRCILPAMFTRAAAVSTKLC